RQYRKGTGRLTTDPDWRRTSPSRSGRAAGLGRCPCRAGFSSLQQQQTIAQRTGRAYENKPWAAPRRREMACGETLECACAPAVAASRSRATQPHVRVREYRCHSLLENSKHQHALPVLLSAIFEV